MDPNIIAWLVPSYGDSLALQATQMRQNTHMAVKRFHHTALPDGGPSPALALSFDRPPRGRSGFLLGTGDDCDIVLPSVHGVSRHHCYLSFDAEHRLVLKDTSRNGTAVWYDHHSNGDRTNASWVLSSGGSYGFPDLVRRLVVDIQTIRFQVVVHDPSADLDGYTQRVARFLDRVARRHEPVFPSSLLPPDAERLEEPRRVYLKYTLQSGAGPEQTFVWNTARPWEPIVQVAA
jgi:hypothetical protein